MKHKRDVEILIGVLLIMSTTASIVALFLYHLFAVNILIGVTTLISAWILRSTKLVAAFIPGLGIAGALIVLTRDLLVMFGLFEQPSLWGILMVVPFFGYKIILSARLFGQGFDEDETPQLPKQNLFQLAKSQ